MITMQRELERACRMKNMDMSAVLEYLAEADSDKLMDLRGAGDQELHRTRGGGGLVLQGDGAAQ